MQQMEKEHKKWRNDMTLGDVMGSIVPIGMMDSSTTGTSVASDEDSEAGTSTTSTSDGGDQDDGPQGPLIRVDDEQLNREVEELMRLEQQEAQQRLQSPRTLNRELNLQIEEDFIRQRHLNEELNLDLQSPFRIADFDDETESTSS